MTIVLLSIFYAISIDCPALLSFASGLEMLNSEYIELRTGDCCGQQNVWCENGRIVNVNWNFRDLSGIINNTALNLLTSLYHLEIGANQIHGPFPTRLLDSLTTFNFGTNFITGSIGYISNIADRVVFDKNQISGDITSIPSKVTDLCIHNNPFVFGKLHLDLIINIEMQRTSVSRLFIEDTSLISACDISDTPLYNTQVAYLPIQCNRNNIIQNTECEVVAQIAKDLEMDKINPDNYNLILSDCCGAIGITCDENSHVRSINWSGMSLNGTVDTNQIELLFSYLQHFNVSNNKLTGRYGFNFTSNVMTLDISNNNFTGILSGYSLWRLTLMNISNNNFFGQVDKLPQKLQTLGLANNHFTGSFPLVPSTLIALDIANNKFNGNLTLNTPQYLDIKNNYIERIGINSTASLTYCNLLGNLISDYSDIPQICVFRTSTTSKLFGLHTSIVSTEVSYVWVMPMGSTESLTKTSKLPSRSSKHKSTVAKRLSTEWVIPDAISFGTSLYFYISVLIHAAIDFGILICVFQFIITLKIRRKKSKATGSYNSKSMGY